jgi:hypothetical protein
MNRISNFLKIAFIAIGIALLAGGLRIWLNVRHRPVRYYDYTFVPSPTKLSPSPSFNH